MLFVIWVLRAMSWRICRQTCEIHRFVAVSCLLSMSPCVRCYILPYTLLPAPVRQLYVAQLIAGQRCQAAGVFAARKRNRLASVLCPLQSLVRELSPNHAELPGNRAKVSALFVALSPRKIRGERGLVLLLHSSCCCACCVSCALTAHYSLSLPSLCLLPPNPL